MYGFKLEETKSLLAQAESEGENEATEGELNALAVGLGDTAIDYTATLVDASGVSMAGAGMIVGGLNSSGLTGGNNLELDDGSNESGNPLNVSATDLMGDYIPEIDNPAQEVTLQSQQQLETLRNARQDQPSEEIIERMLDLMEPPSPSENDGEVSTIIFDYYKISWVNQ